MARPQNNANGGNKQLLWIGGVIAALMALFALYNAVPFATVKELTEVKKQTEVQLAQAQAQQKVDIERVEKAIEKFSDRVEQKMEKDQQAQMELLKALAEIQANQKALSDEVKNMRSGGRKKGDE